MKILNTVIIVLSALFSMSIVLVGTQRLAKMQPRRRNSLIIITLLSYLVLLIIQVPQMWLSNGIVILASISGGLLICSFNRSKGGVVAFVITAAVVDFFSFSGGLTRWIINNNKISNTLVLQYLTISLHLEGHIQYIIGIGDLMIASAVGVSLNRLKYPPWRTNLVLLSAVLFAISIGLTVGSIPALPIIAFVTVLYIALQPN
jgi:hypothetical protein